jgi:hypothetical protein
MVAMPGAFEVFDGSVEVSVYSSLELGSVAMP